MDVLDKYRKQIEELIEVDPFHCKKSPLALRACVGNNSGVNIFSRDCFLLEGYNDAVKFMMSALLRKEATMDTIIYPFLFCCRHAIELSLKILLKNFIVIYKIQNKIKTEDAFTQSINETLKTHSIHDLSDKLEEFKAQNKEINKELTRNAFLFEFVKDYFFDADGDSFRYTFKRNWTDINLERITLVDVGVFFEKFKILSETFDQLINIFSSWLFTQYYKGSYTKNLTREDLEAISKKLPTYSEWTPEVYSKMVDMIGKEYDISKKEATKAIELIEHHYQFSANIGHEIKFKDLKEDTIIRLATLLEHEKHKTEVEVGAFSPESDLMELYRENIIAIPREDILILLTFCDMGTPMFDRDYVCEDLDYLYKEIEKDPPVPFEEIDRICCILKNGQIRKAFKKCGQTTYLKWHDKYIQPLIEKDESV